MPSWVFARPPLANKDFTHFTPKGAKIVAEMLFKSIESEYEKYNRR
jgi:lysophospholipase L1-like esterase